ncbi:hypothetical protein [Lysobacter sp. HA35]
MSEVKHLCPPLTYGEAMDSLHDLAMLEGRGCRAANTLLQIRATLTDERAAKEAALARLVAADNSSRMYAEQMGREMQRAESAEAELRKVREGIEGSAVELEAHTRELLADKHFALAGAIGRAVRALRGLLGEGE